MNDKELAERAIAILGRDNPYIKPTVNEDPIYLFNERQDRYWREQGGRDPEPTYRAGWKERYQRVLREAPK